MFNLQISLVLHNKTKLWMVFAAGLGLFIAANIIVDFLFALIRNSGFYFSESLLFSSYWILYIPLIWLHLGLLKKSGNALLQWLSVGLATMVHLLAYPAIVWFISSIFYDHSFPFIQTFSFGLSAYCLQTVLIYAAIVFVCRSVFTFSEESSLTNLTPTKIQQDFMVESTKQDVLLSILVTGLHNNKEVLSVADILYFTSKSPYIYIHHRGKTYLHSETLKSLENQLNSEHFARIHKSCIVNLNFVSSIRSRNNGDYDITLSNGNALRLSRNYARAFKAKWEVLHQLSC